MTRSCCSQYHHHDFQTHRSRSSSFEDTPSTMKITLITLSTMALLSTYVMAGPIAWGLCQTACNAGYCVCCTAAGAVAGMSSLTTLFTFFSSSSSMYELLADANRNLHRRYRYSPCPSWVFGHSGHLYGCVHSTHGSAHPVK
jgi:hypothetical protein